MDTASFDYKLPEARIAQHPVDPRDSSRLLVDRGPITQVATGEMVVHARMRELADYLNPGDVVVINTTRVMPARLSLRKDTGGAAEVLLLERLSADANSGSWEALVRPGKRLPPGSVLTSKFDGGVLRVEVGNDLGDGVRLVSLVSTGISLIEAIDFLGEMPLPPYITAQLDDPDRYQTIYADPHRAHSSAAPTAGLHFTPEVFAGLARRGISVAEVELVVGLGTFRPIESERIEDHRMHSERYSVPAATLAACERAHLDGNNVVAIGTTVVRALESAAATGNRDGSTELFIAEGFGFQIVDRLVTNFHLPRSSLLVMVDAFAGPRWRDLYRVALDGNYRFLSFGDAMVLTRKDRWNALSNEAHQ
ncbi:MAG: tRNA preQ1(34) S-adenosylmethionine ribosyltransferase-isomerase QueA [Actinomycetes bacterium]